MSVVYSAGVTTGIRCPLSDLPDHINYESLEISVENHFPGFETHWVGNAWGKDEDKTEIIIGYKDSTVYYRNIDREYGVEQVDRGWIYELVEDFQEIAKYYGIENNAGLYFFASVG